MIALLLLVAGTQLAVTPVQKVIELMSGMKAKGEAEMKAEVELFGEYLSWCKVTSRQKDVAITAYDDRIGMLRAKVQRADADVAKLGDDVAELDAEIAGMNTEKRESTEVRASERADFVALSKDYSESLDAMAGALRTLKRVGGNIGNAFVQRTVQALQPRLPAKAQRVVAAFLEEGSRSSGNFGTNPTGNAYESSVGSVIEMIEGLEAKLSEENAQSEHEESSAQHGYSMLQQQLTMALETAQDERDTKAARKAERADESATSGGNLMQTSSTRNSDASYRADLQSLCSVKQEDFEARQQLRKEELEALQKAIDIIGSGSVAGKADKHLPALVQTKKAFALLRAESSGIKVMKAKVAALLQAAAAKHGSTALLQAAEKVQDGPFDKVTQMIQNLIVKLQTQAAEEADHKGWCDGELTSNKQTRDQKTAGVDELTALSEKLNAEIQRLSQEMADLAKAISELDAAVTEATSTRTKEKSENTEAVADAKEAQVAVRRATGVLKAFYSKAATATALVQSKAKAKAKQPSADAPGSFDTPYQGMGGSSTGVMGMLETILSDFVRLETETRTGEIQAQRSFDRFAADSAADRADKDAALDAATKAKTSSEKDLNQAQEDLARTQTELQAAWDSYDELKTSCVDAAVSYSERVTRREEEIASLKDALKVLSDE